MRTLVLSLALCCMVSLESTTIKWVQKVQPEDIPSEQLVFLVEVFKLLVSIGTYITVENIKTTNFGTGYQPLQDNQNDPLTGTSNANIVWFFLPAVLYAISNNITFAALLLMNPGLFNILMNLKIPVTGLMACTLLHYKLTQRLASSFTLLFFGTIFATLKLSQGHIEVDGSIYGILLMLAYSMCSGGAAVYTEYVMKSRYPNESIHLQNIKFCICSAIANVLIMMVRGTVPYTTIHLIHLASVAALGLNGLITAAVLKYAGSIVKTYAVSCSAFLSALLTWVIFHQNLHWNFYVGALISVVAVQLYIYERSS